MDPRLTKKYSRTSLASGYIKWVNIQKAQISGIKCNVSSTVNVSSQSPQFPETEF